MGEESELTFDYYVLLPHIHKPQILLVAVEQGWSLPHWEVQTLYFWQDVMHVNRSMQKQFGLETSVLRCLSSHYDPTKHRTQRVYELENHSAKWQPPVYARWIGQEQLADVQFVFPEQRRMLETWFAENQPSSSSTLKTPWAQRGWLKSACEWIHSQLTKQGLTATTSIEQLRAWERSALLMVGTDSGNVYFKALPTMFAYELSLTQLLSAVCPQSSPVLLAVDVEQRWMLMHDFGGIPLQQDCQLAHWEQALQQFACLQIQLSQQLDEMLIAGCSYRPLDLLASQVEPMIAALSTLTPNQRGDLTTEDIEQLRALIPQLVALCDELAHFNIPYSLEHGDLWATNVIVTDGNVIFFDWSDSSIAQPFFSLLLILESLNNTHQDIRSKRKTICASYLQPWVNYGYASLEQLQRAFQLAQCLAPLHYAATYYQTILPAIGAKWELERMFPFYLKMLLRNMQEYNS